MAESKRAGIVSAVICLIFAIIYYILTINLPPGALFEQISTEFVPKLLAYTIAGLSLLLILAILLEPGAQTDSDSLEQSDKPAFYGTVAVAFLSLLCWHGIGFFSIPLLVGGTMVVNRSKNCLQIVGVAAGVTFLLYLVFFRIFELPLPLGMLE